MKAKAPHTTAPHLKSGQQAENEACRHLTQHGLLLIEQNFRCRLGEIDLIMWDNKTLVFVEVRFRTLDHFGGAAASISEAKQRRIIRTAQTYLTRHQGREPACRFDVVTLSPPSAINWIKDAFCVH